MLTQINGTDVDNGADPTADRDHDRPVPKQSQKGQSGSPTWHKPRKIGQIVNLRNIAP